MYSVPLETESVLCQGSQDLELKPFMKRYVCHDLQTKDSCKVSNNGSTKPCWTILMLFVCVLKLHIITEFKEGEGKPLLLRYCMCYKGI